MGRGARRPRRTQKTPLPPLKKKVPETFGDPAQNTDLDALYPTMPSVPRETTISGPEHFWAFPFLHFGASPRTWSGMTGVGITN